MRRVLPGMGVALVFAACAGGAGTIGDPGPIGGSSGGNGNGDGGGGSADGGGSINDAASDAGANPTGCPTSYADTVPGTCEMGLVCKYPQGRCECAGACGAAPPPGEETRWVCRTKVDNGCPDDPPTPGTLCNVPVTCSYGTCCIESFTCAPGSGMWRSNGPPICPP